MSLGLAVKTKKMGRKGKLHDFTYYIENSFVAGLFMHPQKFLYLSLGHWGDLFYHARRQSNFMCGKRVWRESI